MMKRQAPRQDYDDALDQLQEAMNDPVKLANIGQTQQPDYAADMPDFNAGVGAPDDYANAWQEQPDYVTALQGQAAPDDTPLVAPEAAESAAGEAAPKKGLASKWEELKAELEKKYGGDQQEYGRRAQEIEDQTRGAKTFETVLGGANQINALVQDFLKNPAAAASFRGEAGKTPYSTELATQKGDLAKWLAQRQAAKKGDVEGFFGAARAQSMEDENTRKQQWTDTQREIALINQEIAKAKLDNDTTRLHMWQKKLEQAMAHPGASWREKADYNFEHQKELLRLKGDEKDAAATAKQDKKNATLALDGFYFKDDHMPTDKQADKAREAQGMRDDLREGVQRLAQLYREAGTEKLPTEIRDRMAALATELQLAAKGEKMYQLGVLTGNDLQLLKRVIPDPTDINWKNVLGYDNTLARLDEFDRSVERKFRTYVKPFGYLYGKEGDADAPAPQTRQTTTIKAAPAPAGMVHFMMDGESYDIPAAMAAKFKKENPGAKQVQ